jgi:hypothetical protein
VRSAGANAWHRLAYATGVDFVMTPGPLAFVLGAGASLTSKCPKTDVVDVALQELIMRWPERTVREVLYRVEQTEVQTRLAPLFADAVPYIGYVSLAALGRRRRVHVLNLNWDPMIEVACERLGIPCLPFDLKQPPADDEIDAALPPNGGVLIAHVHGRLGESCRYDYLSTLKLDAAEKDFVASYFTPHPRVFAGVSLRGDSDLVDLLWDAEGPAPTWYFGRGLAAADVDDLRELLPHHAQLVVDDEVDFDDLMVILLGKVSNFIWDDFRRGREAIYLPSFSQIAWPKKRILRPFLTQRICPLINGSRVGKSTIAHLLAYLKTLWYADWPSGDYVRTFKGTRATVAALSPLAPGDVGALILEDVFGAGRFDENPTLLNELERVVAASRGLTVILTSRIDRWQDAAPPRGPLVAGRKWHPRDSWYERARLKQFAGVVADGDRAVLEAIEDRRLQTPAQIFDHVKGVERTAAAPVEEKLRVLERSHELALVCTLIRLARFRSEPVTLEFVSAQLRGSIDDIDFARAFLHDFPFEDGRCLTLRHDEDVEAVDCYLRQRGVGVVAAEVEALLRVDVEDVVARWAAAQSVERGDVDAVLDTPSDVLADIAPDVLRAGWRDARVVGRLIATQFDQWSLLDLAYELVRLWPLMDGAPHCRRLLDRMLDDRGARGAYAILEACLYLPGTASDEIWSKLNTRLWQRLESVDAGEEVALAIDALLWRPPPPERAIGEWVAAAEKAITDGDRRSGLWRFVAAYHPAGAQAMISHTTLITDTTVGLDDEQRAFAAGLVGWHFVHQSRARALLNRQPWVDKDFLCRSTYRERAGAGADDVERLVLSLAQGATTAPWAFHVVCNIMSNPSAAPIKPEVVELGGRALALAPAGHPGVVTAAATYESSRLFTAELVEYFKDADARDALLEALAAGVVIDGTRVAPPRFVFALPADLIYDICGIDWPALDALWPDRVDSLVATLLAEARRRAAALVAAGHDPRRVRAATTRLARGDLRHCERGAQQRQPAGASGDAIFQMLELAVMAEDVTSADDGRLF